jgi:hypothetical protein
MPISRRAVQHMFEEIPRVRVRPEVPVLILTAALITGLRL